VSGHRVVPIKIFARGGDFDPASPAQCAAKKIPEEAPFSNFDRLILAGLYRIARRIVNALVIIGSLSAA
jgi:hypothetical protein